MGAVAQSIASQSWNREVWRLEMSLYDVMLEVERFLELRVSTQKPAVIVVGETHRVANHVLFQMALLESLLEKYQPQELAASIEIPFNLDAYTPTISLTGGNFPVTEIRDEEQNKQRILDVADIFQTHGDNAAITHAVFYRYLMERQISTRMADLNCILKGEKPEDTVIDLRGMYYHPYTPHMSCYAGANIRGVSPFGFSLRNEFTAAVAAVHMKDIKPKLYLHFGGALHVSGGTNWDATRESDGELLYKDSLMRRFIAQGHDTCGLILSERENAADDYTPPDFLPAFFGTGHIFAHISGSYYEKDDLVREQEMLRAVLPQLIPDLTF